MSSTSTDNPSTILYTAPHGHVVCVYRRHTQRDRSRDGPCVAVELAVSLCVLCELSSVLCQLVAGRMCLVDVTIRHVVRSLTTIRYVTSYG